MSSFGSLSKLSNNRKQQNPLDRLIFRVKDLPFYCNQKERVNCCFWHILIPPTNLLSGEPSPLFDYQIKVIEELESIHRIATVKSRNLGMSELALRYALYLTLSKRIPGNYLFVTGVGYLLSTTLARRVREILAKHAIYFDDNMTTLTFPSILARWSFHGSDASSWRGQTNVVFLLADELTTFQESENPMSVIDTYNIKNPSAYVWLICTPGYKLDGFAYKLFNDPDESKILYKRQFLDYTLGINKMFSQQDIDLLKQRSLSFDTEFNLKWGGFLYSGNIFTTEKINSCIIPKLDFDEEILKKSAISVGVDPAYSLEGSSFAFTCLAVVNDKVYVTDSFNQKGLDFSASVEKLFNTLSLRYDWYQRNNRIKIYVDAAFPSFIRSACAYAGDQEEYEKQLEYAHHNKIPPESLMQVIPIPFATQGSSMMQNIITLISDGKVKIPSKFESLIQDLRQAKLKQNLNLDKSMFSMDSLDSFRLACRGIVKR